MRRILLPIAAVSLLLAACQERDTMRVVPDRQGHAGGMADTDTKGLGMQLVPHNDETWYTVEAGDKLYAIAKRFNTTIEALIKRNRLSDEQVKPGQQLVVPKPVAGSTTRK